MSKDINKKPKKTPVVKSVNGKEQERGHEENSVTSEIIEIEEELEHLNPDVFKGINNQKKGEILQTIRKISMMSVTQNHHSGPLPSSETMVQYNSVIPNGADRIMIMAEKQQEHRMIIEKTAIKSQLSQSNKGQIFGFVLCILIIIASTYLGSTGHETIGSILGSTTIIAMASIFVLGKLNKPKKTKEEDLEKE
ncbi:DUF2335 domain-containing protein [Flavobacterium degerlachei]|jgi:uncharacterized membrane protein|uniref:Uncharacterized membrane protein n=1 Tax=Flavobacterium degerlachei TaxID=229203 RepID=A0A1H3B5Y8_9FLAO|nr:DUF2335 domain-containing protein [Flavobacterium degerlachei]SDX37347.1 Uncharacterized membrane protein [Flavobacterium degerlachei]